MRRLIQRLLRLFTEQRVLALIQILISVGVAGVIATALNAIFALPTLFLLSLFVLLCGLSLLGLYVVGPTLARIGAETEAITKGTTNRLALPPTTEAPSAPKSRVDAFLETTEAKIHMAIHEALTTLEEHEGVLLHWPGSFPPDLSPKYQGEWPNNRVLLTADGAYNDAYRQTERAFQAIARLENPLDDDDPHQIALRRQALEAIARARTALEQALDFMSA